MLTVRNLNKRYGARAVLNGVSFTGEVLFKGQDITAMGGDELNGFRRKIGVLFQQGALLQSLTVGENVSLPMREHTALDENIIRIMIKMKLELVGLRDFDDLYPSQLSSGMQKRVALARALALDPEVIFFDEPTSGLDPITSSVITKLIPDLNRLLGVSCIVVTHAVEDALRTADRIVLLYQGKVLADGAPEEIRASADPVVQQFITGSPDGPIAFRASSKDYREDLLVG
jgi:phospholipid/cholesterol/gamma-HCH transport system ATP-binding protein